MFCLQGTESATVNEEAKMSDGHSEAAKINNLDEDQSSPGWQ